MSNLGYPQSDFVNDLCEYYNVNAETAIKLGTRSDGRKPHLPGSKTCRSVTGKTYEDIWELKPRETISDVFDFYLDQGSWSSFRQVVRHNDLVRYHVGILQTLLTSIAVKDSLVFLEYGCGVAPFARTLVEFIEKQARIDILLSDVAGCEHFEFGAWRLQRKIDERQLNSTVSVIPVEVDALPKYDKEVDIAFIFEVLEHVPSPVATIQNIGEQLRAGGLLVENFIKHVDGDGDDGPDLISARQERDNFYAYLIKNFELIHGGHHQVNTNETRIWRKK